MVTQRRPRRLDVRKYIPSRLCDSRRSAVAQARRYDFAVRGRSRLIGANSSTSTRIWLYESALLAQNRLPEAIKASKGWKIRPTVVSSLLRILEGVVHSLYPAFFQKKRHFEAAFSTAEELVFRLPYRLVQRAQLLTQRRQFRKRSGPAGGGNSCSSGYRRDFVFWWELHIRCTPL